MGNRVALCLSFSAGIIIFSQFSKASPRQTSAKVGKALVLNSIATKSIATKPPSKKAIAPNDVQATQPSDSYSNWWTYISRLVKPVVLQGFSLSIANHAEVPLQGKTLSVDDLCQLTLLPSHAPYLDIQFGGETFQVTPLSPGNWRGFNSNSSAYIDISMTELRLEGGAWSDYVLDSISRSSVLDNFQFIKSKSGTTSQECHFLKNSVNYQDAT
jgi:hypothetical protein